MTLGRRTLVNAIFNTMSWGLPMVLSFFILPYIVTRLGNDAYGILTMVLTIIGYFAFLDLGLGNAVVKYVAEYNAEGDSDKLNGVVGTIFFLLLVLGGIGGAGILLVARPMAAKFLQIPPHLVDAAFTAFCVGALGFVFTVLLSFVSAIPNGLNRYDVSSIVSVTIGTITTAGTAVILYFGFGLLQIVWYNIAVTAAGVISYWILVKRLAPALRIRPVLRRDMLKHVISFGMYSVLRRIAYLVNYHADRLVIGALLGIASVTYYVVPFTMVSRLTSITVRIGQVIFPAISELQGQRRYGAINELYVVASRVICAVAVSICIPLAIFGRRLLTLWMGQDFGEHAGWVMVIVTLALFFSALTNVPSYVVEGLGLPRISGFAAFGCALLNVGLAIPLAKPFGITGVAIAFLASNAVIAPIFIGYVNGRVLKLPLWRTLSDAYLRPFLCGLLTLTPFLFISQESIGNLFLLLGVVASASCCYLVACFLLGVFPQQVEILVHGFFRKGLRRNENTAG